MATTQPRKSAPYFPRREATPSLNRGPAHDVLAADMLAFEQAGGVIEMLGTTRMFKWLPMTESAHPSPARAPGKARFGSG